MLRQYAGRIGAFLILTAVYLIIAGTARYQLSAITAAIEEQPTTIVIDAGHGGEDGGAVGITGTKESLINLEISTRLDYLLTFCGYQTEMIRTEDCAVYTEGTSLSEKKVSDLKQRVKMVNSAEPAILLSVHQNHFSDSRYSGAQVFYAKTNGSKELALLLQSALCDTLDPENNRTAKEADSVYLLKQISCPGVLIECGFLSNQEEEVRLQDGEYQKMLVCVITNALSQFTSEGEKENEV